MTFNHLERRRGIVRVLVVTFVLNIAIALGKLIYGYASGTMSVLADGFHSLMDGTSNIVGLVAIYFASAPPDREHPYGHRKAEILASLLISVMLAVSCLEIIKELIVRMIHPQVPQVHLFGFGLILLGLGVNLFVVNYESRAGRRLQSQILLADAEHTRSDVLVTLSVLVSMGAIWYQWYWLDYLVSLAIVFFIGRVAYQLFRQNIDVLMDRIPLSPERVAELVYDCEGVENCHQIRSHGSPDEVYLELHIWVDPDLSVRLAHDLSHRVKDHLMEALPELCDVTIHIEPAERNAADAQSLPQVETHG